ncbi:Fur family transcriptional regulator [candidate division KSB1 bacterium]
MYDETRKLLRKNEISATKNKVALLQELQDMYRPLDAYELHRKVSERVQMDLATVYRTLTQFRERGIIRELYDKTNVLYYEVVSGNKKVHPHFKCDNCLQYFCLPPLSKDDREALSRMAARFQVDDMIITMSGLCTDCREED